MYRIPSLTVRQKNWHLLSGNHLKSKYSGVDLCAGIIQNNNKLVIESYMPFNGKIFSDGIESDFLNFNSGHIVKIGIAKEKAKLVV